MSTERYISGTFAILLSLAFKLVNNCKKNTENESILNVTFNFLHNSHYSRRFSTCLGNSLTISPNRYLVNVQIS